MEEMLMKSKFGSRLKRIIFTAVALILFLVATNPAILWFLPESTKESISESWQRVFGDVGAVTKTVHINWITIFQVIAIILFMILAANIFKFVVERIHPKTGKGKSIHSLFSSVITYMIFLVACVWCLSVIGVNISTIFASIGILALIVGFAAESLIADIITGIFLVFEDEFNVGDIIEIGSFRGEVISIGVRVTCVRDSGGNVKMINNSDIRNVLNRSKSISKAVCDIPISYNADLGEVEAALAEILKEIPKNYPEVFKESVNYAGVQELAESSVNLRLVATVAEKDVFTAVRIMNREVKIGFDKAGIEIPFPQIVVHMS